MSELDLMPEEIAKFWSWMEIKSDDECWNWTHGLDTNGYGHIKIRKKGYTASRLAWRLTHGEIEPKSLCVCHTCNNPKCNNYKKHLYLDTRKGNAKYMMECGRQNFQKHPETRPTGDRNGSRTHPERLPHGEAHKKSKLTTEQVIEIRRLYGDGNNGISQYQLADTFGVSQGQIGDIIRRVYWRDVP